MLIITTALVACTAAPGLVNSNVPMVIMIRNAAQVKCVAVSIFIMKVTALNVV